MERGEGMTDKKTAKALVDAMNLISAYIEENLSEGWSIEVCFTKEETCVNLFDPNEDLISVDNYGCTIRDMCDVSNEENGSY